MNLYQNPTQKVKEIPLIGWTEFRTSCAITYQNLRGNKRKSVFSHVFPLSGTLFTLNVIRIVYC